jgi:hypothetical protein
VKIARGRRQKGVDHRLIRIERELDVILLSCGLPFPDIVHIRAGVQK